MPQPKRGYTLGANPAHQKLMLRNLAQSLFEHERIKTTEAKAKALRPYAERLITKAKKGSIHHRRQVASDIENRTIVHKLFDDIGPRFADRNGGYTRVLKLGQRNGDGAPMALIELVEGAKVTTSETTDASRRRRGLRRSRRETDETTTPAASGEMDETPSDEDEEPSVEEETVDGGADVDDADEPVASAQEPAATEDSGESPPADEDEEKN